MRMRNIVICGPARLYCIFQHYLINGTIFEKENVEHEMCVLIPSCLKHLSERDMIKMYIGLHVKYPLFLSTVTKLDL